MPEDDITFGDPGDIIPGGPNTPHVNDDLAATPGAEEDAAWPGPDESPAPAESPASSPAEPSAETPPEPEPTETPSAPETPEPDATASATPTDDDAGPEPEPEPEPAPEPPKGKGGKAKKAEKPSGAPTRPYTMLEQESAVRLRDLASALTEAQLAKLEGVIEPAFFEQGDKVTARNIEHAITAAYTEEPPVPAVSGILCLSDLAFRVHPVKVESVTVNKLTIG